MLDAPRMLLLLLLLLLRKKEDGKANFTMRQTAKYVSINHLRKVGCSLCNILGHLSVPWLYDNHENVIWRLRIIYHSFHRVSALVWHETQFCRHTKCTSYTIYIYKYNTRMLRVNIHLMQLSDKRGRRQADSSYQSISRHKH